MTNQKMCPLVCEQALHFGGIERIHAGAARERRRQKLSFNCNMFMCVICQKFYSKNPVVVYFGVGIPQRKVFLAQG